MRFAAPLVIVPLLSCPVLLPAADASPERVGFATDLAPLLVQKCLGCHGPQKQKGGYRLDTFDRLMRPGDSKSAPVSPGRPGDSELYRLVTHADPHQRMPQKDDPLSAAQIATIERWIRQGAAFDGPERSASLQSLVRVTHPTAPPTYPHPVPASALAFHPDGTTLAVGGYHEITLWEATTGKLVGRIGNVAQQTHALAYSPDGTLLAAAGGTPGSLGEVRVVPASDPTAARVLDRIGDVMLGVCFGPDGRTLAAGGADGAVRVYDVASGRRTLLVEQHADWVTAVAFSPDGTKLSTASRDKSARVFDSKTGEMLSAYFGHEQPLFAVAWSPDGKRLYSGGRDREVHAWEPAAEPKKLRQITGFGGDVLRLSAAGESLYSTCADGKLRRHNLANGELLNATDAAPEWLTGLARDASHLATGAFDGSVRLHDPATLRSTAAFVAAPRQ
jgi:WD40 repeat protein